MRTSLKNEVIQEWRQAQIQDQESEPCSYRSSAQAVVSQQGFANQLLLVDIYNSVSVSLCGSMWRDKIVGGLQFRRVWFIGR